MRIMWRITRGNLFYFLSFFVAVFLVYITFTSRNSVHDFALETQQKSDPGSLDPGYVRNTKTFEQTVKTENADKHSVERILKQVGQPSATRTRVDNRVLRNATSKPGAISKSVPEKNKTADVSLHDETTTANQQGQELEHLHVYVVEEHHEVVPYWFEAVEKGIIPKSGNTLVHIDGHADMAAPFNVPGYPLFTWPRESDLKYFMQANDIFIKAAAMAGLVDRVIWVWPEWDSPNHAVDYIKHNLSFGFKINTFGDKGGHTGSDFCLCYKNLYFVECRYFPFIENADSFFNSETFVGLSLPERNCSAIKSIVYEEIREKKIASYLNKPGWIRKTEDVFIDIDEDYYGNTYAIQPLLDSNLTVLQVEQLSNVLNTMFCPDTTPQEQYTDMFLSKMLSFLYLQRVCKLSRTKVDKCRRVAQLELFEYFSSMLEDFMSKSAIKLCPDELDFNNVYYLFSEFSKLTTMQLKSLFEVGFCSDTSAKTFTLYRERNFRICYGANTPEETVVYEHTPTPREISLRSQLLKKIAGRLKTFSPKLVTICRSVRDGFTPREHFKYIEKDILDVSDSFSDKPAQVHFDSDLLGGEKGWSSRGRPEAILNILFDDSVFF